MVIGPNLYNRNFVKKSLPYIHILFLWYLSSDFH